MLSERFFQQALREMSCLYPIKISLIVPFYNSGDLLSQCLDSIKKQTFRDYELILVDDCSTDGSYEIAVSYKDTISNLTIIKQEKNKGAGAARNRALEKVQGEYAFFVDSDDMLADENVLEALNRHLIQESVDLIYFRHQLIDPDTQESADMLSLYERNFWSRVSRNQSYDINDMLLFPAYPWNKVIRSEFICENDFRFTETFCHNDLAFVVKCILEMKNFSLIDKTLILHRHGSEFNQTTNIISDKRFDLFPAFGDVNEYIRNHNITLEKKAYYLKFKIELFFWGLERIRPDLVKNFIFMMSKDLRKIEKQVWKDFNSIFSIPVKERVKYSFIKDYPGLYVLFKEVKKAVAHGN